MKARDLHGLKFNKLLVTRWAGNDSGRNLWECTCECGNKVISIVGELTSGRRKSCGCIKRNPDSYRKCHLTHGLTNTPEFDAWHAIKQRCHNKNNKNYYRYGGRGITVCDRWFNSFENFINDMGKRPGPNYSIDRIDNDKGYSETNCRWATAIEQNNNKSSNRRVNYRGTTASVAEHCRRLGLNRASVKNRLHNGWTIEQALSEPIRKKEILFNDKLAPISVHCRELGLSYCMVKLRLQRGWPIKKAFTGPVRKTKRR